MDHVSVAAVEAAEHSSDPSQWTVVVAAAGRGSRLGFDKCKILYPVGDKTILEWLVTALDKFARHFVFVLSESGQSEVETYLKRLLPGRASVVIQPAPLGMADAVWVVRDAVRTKNVLVVWGDQIGLNPQTVRCCMALQQSRLNARCTMPTFVRDNPYIHFHCDQTGRLVKVLQAREGDPMPNVGEADCGLFCFDTVFLFKALSVARALPQMYGAVTREWNLLPVLELLDDGPGALTCVRVRDVIETVGINTAADGELMEQYWNVLRKNRRQSSTVKDC